MAKLRNILRLSHKYRQYHTSFLFRNKPITGYEGADNALQAVTGGRINRWLDAYEDFVGLTEVRNAQEQVTEAEGNYRQVQEERRSTQQFLTSVQTKIKAVAMDIEKTKRGTDAYLDLVTRENDIIKDEKDVLEQLTVLEDNEKRLFGLLSSALRESHEKERARAERMKYWGIMGSIIGAVIGILGTTVNNYLRMKELRRIVTTSAESNQTSREKTFELYVGINEQYGKIYQLLSDIRSAAGIKLDDTTKQKEVTKVAAISQSLATESKLEELIASLKKHEEKLEQEIQKLGPALSMTKLSGDESKTVVYVGPEIEKMFKDSEKNMEWKMKIQALGTVTLVYAVGAIVLPLVWELFGGS